MDSSQQTQMEIRQHARERFEQHFREFVPMLEASGFVGDTLQATRRILFHFYTQGAADARRQGLQADATFLLAYGQSVQIREAIAALSHYLESVTPHDAPETPQEGQEGA